VAQGTNARIAIEALRRIGELYAIEVDVRGQSPEHKLAARHHGARPLFVTARKHSKRTGASLRNHPSRLLKPGISSGRRVRENAAKQDF
jgi:hypothetical protein